MTQYDDRLKIAVAAVLANSAMTTTGATRLAKAVLMAVDTIPEKMR